MLDLKTSDISEIKKLQVGEQFIGADGKTYEITSNDEETVAYKSL